MLGLFLCLRLTLTYLRHNTSGELLAEVYGVSQATVSPGCRRLHAFDRPRPGKQRADGRGPGSHGPADRGRLLPDS